MSIDASTLPFSPMFIVAAAGYAAFSLLISGPEMADREIARSNWTQTCEANLTAELEATRKPKRVVPNVPNVGAMLCDAMELYQYCHMIPDPNAPAREAARRAAEAEDARIKAAAAGIGDRCACAEAVYATEEMVSLGLYAGTARLYTPKAVENRSAALTRALNGRACSPNGRARS